MTVAKKAINFSSLEGINLLDFKDSNPVSTNSIYGDNVWDLSKSGNEREFIYSKSHYSVNFDGFGLSKSIIKDLKVFGYLLIIQPDTFRSKDNKAIRRTRKHKSAAEKIKLIFKVIKHISESQIKIYGFSTLNSLSDITPEMLQNAFDTINYVNLKSIRTALFCLCNHHVQKFLPSGKLSFNENDISQIRFQKPKVKGTKSRTMPDELYAFISEKSSAKVLEFLYLIGEPTLDNSGNVNRELTAKYPYFKDMFNDFKLIWARVLKNDIPVCLISDFENRYGITYTQFKSILINIQMGAQMLILLYTGLRSSEILTLKVGCVFKQNSHYFIRGTLIKNVSDEYPVDDSQWLIIPMIRDAVKCLEIFAEMNNKRYLCCTFEPTSDKPYARQTFPKKVKAFIKSIDVENKWKNDIPSPHMFRHSFIQMLQRARVGLPYISLYVKHTFTEMNYLPNSTTGGYGNYLKNMFDEVSSIRKQSVVSDLLSNNIAGSGSDKFIIKTEAFFEGQALSGSRLEHYLNMLNMDNITPIPTGIGLCIKDWGVKQSNDNSPCLKTFQCSQSCSNNIVIKSILPTLKDRLRDTESKLKDSNYQYINESLISKRNILQEAIIALEENNNEP